jgi:hypothetical protein
MGRPGDFGRFPGAIWQRVNLKWMTEVSGSWTYQGARFRITHKNYSNLIFSKPAAQTSMG